MVEGEGGEREGGTFHTETTDEGVMAKITRTTCNTSCPSRTWSCPSMYTLRQRTLLLFFFFFSFDLLCYLLFL